MNLSTTGALRFQEAYMPRVWGGRRLHTRFGKAFPPDQNIGEAWLISDHPVHQSLVAEGSLKGRSLHSLMQEDPAYLLGTAAKPTLHGRFPLLLKLLDAQENLSIQVHPDDACALELGEADGGKSEMWYILDAEKDSVIYCGLQDNAQNINILDPQHPEKILGLCKQFTAQPGQSYLVPAGTVHAIGAGVLLAEIQQNSDLTYRIYDWSRNGQSRELHLEKAAKALRCAPTKCGTPVKCRTGAPAGQSASNKITTLATCPFFTTQHITLNGNTTLNTHAQSPHILLALTAPLAITTPYNTLTLPPGEAALIPAGLGEYLINGNGEALCFFVPEN